MSDLENAVRDVANMQADDLFAERVHAVIRKALNFHVHPASSDLSYLLAEAIKNTVRSEISNTMTALSPLDMSLTGGRAQQMSQYQASSTTGTSPFQQVGVVGSILK